MLQLQELQSNCNFVLTLLGSDIKFLCLDVGSYEYAI